MIRIEILTLIRAPLSRCFDVARSVEVHLAGNTHYGETAVAISGRTAGLLGPSDDVTWQARHFALRWRLSSRITTFEPPHHFQDIQLTGPFRLMRHDHYFRALSPVNTEMRDVLIVAAPIPILGRLAEVLFLRRHMRRLLLERNHVIQAIAESDRWQRYLSCES